MHVYGLIGNPLGHTFSKRYFTEKFQQEELADHQYENFQLANISELEQLIRSVEGLKGLNVTIPFKEQVLPFLHVKTELVQSCGSCNCIRFDGGRLIGYNTDVPGFTRSFKPLLRSSDTHALVLGTGGSSKAICYGLKLLGISYRQVSRSRHSGEVISYDEINVETLKKYSLIINCTPVGSGSLVNELLPFPYHLLTADHYLFDVIYNPPTSKFLAAGERVGARIKNGEEMLIIQAEESWKIWN